MFIIFYIVFLLLFALSIYLGLGKSLIKKKLFILYSLTMIVTSLISSFFLKSIFLFRINSAKEINNFIDDKFIDWANYRFDIYFKWSYIYVIAILVVLLFSLYTDKTIRTLEASTSFSYLTVFSALVLLVTSTIYSLSLLNKAFDIAIYIGTLTALQVFILHLPLVARRMYVGNPMVEGTHYGYQK